MSLPSPSIPLLLTSFVRVVRGTSLLAQTVKNLPAVQEIRFRSLGQEDPWRRAWQPTPVSLPGESHGQRSLAGDSPWGSKEWNRTEWLTLLLCCNHEKIWSWTEAYSLHWDWLFVLSSYVDLDKCIMIWIHHNIIQDSFMVLKLPCTPPIYPHKIPCPQILGKHWSYVSTVCLAECCVVGITQYVAFQIGFFYSASGIKGSPVTLVTWCPFVFITDWYSTV